MSARIHILDGVVDTTNGWEPIETAPKDGSRILLFDPEGDDGEIHKIGWWTDIAARPGWFFRGGWIAEDVPTHWKPLSTPPSPMESG